MKKAILFLAALLFATGLQAQIPNPGFENWSMKNGFLEPDGWETNNIIHSNSPYDTNIFVKRVDSISAEGKFSMYISNETSAFEFGPGNAFTFFRLPSLEDTLHIQIQFPPSQQQGRAVLVNLLGYGTGEQFSFQLVDTVIPNFSDWKLPFSFTTLPDSVKLNIGFGCGCMLPAKGVFIDNLYLKSTLSTSLYDNHQFSIFPNPVEGILKFSANLSFPIDYKIINTSGALKQQGVLKNENLNVEELPPGIYFLQIKVEGKMLQSRFVKE